jgi:hypothetical protein
MELRSLGLAVEVISEEEEKATIHEETGVASAPVAELKAEAPVEAEKEAALPEENIESPTGEAVVSDETTDPTEKEVKEDNA